MMLMLVMVGINVSAKERRLEEIETREHSRSYEILKVENDLQMMSEKMKVAPTIEEIEKEKRFIRFNNNSRRQIN